jgi:hypothetical protein
MPLLCFPVSAKHYFFCVWNDKAHRWARNERKHFIELFLTAQRPVRSRF